MPMLTTAVLALASVPSPGGPTDPSLSGFTLTDSAETRTERTSTAEALPGLLGLEPRAALPAKSGLDLIHPRTFFTYTISTGKQEIMFNTTDPTNVPPNPKGDDTALFHGLRGEYFFANQFGVYFSGDFGQVKDVSIDFNATPESIDVDTLLFFLGASYRATIDDDFRMPVRIGPYYHKATVKGFTGSSDIDYETIGLKLIAEPEYIVFQHLEGERMSELTVFLEVGIGTGPTTVEDSVNKEKGNAFSAGLELGVRYKFFNGILIGLSFIDRKQYYGATDSYDNNFVFFGTEDDYLGAGLTIGGRL